MGEKNKRGSMSKRGGWGEAWGGSGLKVEMSGLGWRSWLAGPTRKSRRPTQIEDQDWLILDEGWKSKWIGQIVQFRLKVETSWSSPKVM